MYEWVSILVGAKSSLNAAALTIAVLLIDTGSMKALPLEGSGTLPSCGFDWICFRSRCWIIGAK